MKISHPLSVVSTILSCSVILPAESFEWTPFLDVIDLETEPILPDLEEPAPPLREVDHGDSYQSQLQLLMTEKPITMDPTMSPTTKPTSKIPSYEYQCPPPDKVGCTAPDLLNPEHECSPIGELCANRPARWGDYCCVDACSRNYCTAKGVLREVIDPIVLDPEEPAPPLQDEGDVYQAQLELLMTDQPIIMDEKPPKSKPSGSKPMKVQALNDKATTFTGQPITVSVLFNDFSQHGGGNGSEDTGMPIFETSLLLKNIATNGNHGTCTINTKSTILYTPNAGYSGSDKCGYQVCHEEDGRVCNFATLSITIAKQAEAEETEVNNAPRPTGTSGDVALIEEQIPILEFFEPTFVDPEILLTDDVWDEVNQAIKDGEEEEEQPSIIVTTPVEQPDDSLAENEVWQEVDFISECDENEVLITIELQTDKHGDDVTWELMRELMYDYNEVEVGDVMKISRGPYEQYSFAQADLCAPSPSLYTFNIYDKFGDGLAGVGYYKIYLDGREIVHVNHYAKSNTHLINVGYDPTSSPISQRNVEYLHAHNKRRRTWHEMYNVSYVPLSWSPKLAEDSLRWANELLDACDSDGIEHETGVPEGENLAKNKGLVKEDGSGWGQLYPPENIVWRWVDREIGWAYPDNAHLTQSLWRASRYMGCGETEKDYKGGKCRVQVCRYAKAGNCDMQRYDSTEGENWLIPMLKDSSVCEPSCPPEGCY